MVRRISPSAPASHTADQPPALGQTLGQELAAAPHGRRARDVPRLRQGGGLGQELAAAFEAEDGYVLTPDDAAALVAQLATLGVRRLKVPPRAP